MLHRVSTIFFVLYALHSAAQQEDTNMVYKAFKSPIAPILDGSDSDFVWQNVPWKTLNHLYIDGTTMSQDSMPTPSDFSGRYKALWKDHTLYIFAEIVDDMLSYKPVASTPADVFGGDSFEIFIDADNSSGAHTKTHNAFAYHISPDGYVADQCGCGSNTDFAGNSGDWAGRFFNYNVRSVQVPGLEPHTHYWELAMQVYSDQFVDAQTESYNAAHLVTLDSGMVMGFGVAYNDYDYRPQRDHMMGSFSIPGNNNGDYFSPNGRNVGWQNASVFGKIILRGENPLCVTPQFSYPNIFIQPTTQGGTTSLQLFNPSKRWKGLDQSFHLISSNTFSLGQILFDTTSGVVSIPTISGYGLIPLTITSSNACETYTYTAVITVCGKPFFTLDPVEVALTKDLLYTDSIAFRLLETSTSWTITQIDPDLLSAHVDSANILHLTLLKDTVAEITITLTATNLCHSFSKKLKVHIESAPVRIQSQQCLIQIYPNPAKDRIYIQSVNHYVNGTLALYNSLGEPLIQSPIVRHLDIRSIPDGLYVLHICSEGYAHNFQLLIAR